MATNATDTTPNVPKPKTVGENMTGRRIFPNITEAVAYLTASADAFEDFGAVPMAAPGMDPEGNFDSELYTAGQQVMVSVLKSGRKVKAIVVAPIPTTAQLLESDAGRAFVDKILQKELNHVAVRHLRDAEDVSTVVDQIPTTLEGYITSGRDGGGGIIEAFNDLYKLIDKTMSAVLPIWAKQRFPKQELRKAMESAGYAAEWYAAQEDYKGESLFVAAIKLGANASKKKGLDPTIFDRWLATRDAKQYTAEDIEELDLDDIDSLTESLLKEGAKGDAAATPATAEPEAAPDAEPDAAAAE